MPSGLSLAARASGPGEPSISVNAPPLPENVALPSVIGAMPRLDMVIVVHAGAPPGRTIIWPRFVPETGFGSATGWQVSAPLSIRSAGSLVEKAVSHAPPSTL